MVRLFEKVDQWMNKEDLQADSDARKRLDDATQVTLTHRVLTPPLPIGGMKSCRNHLNKQNILFSPLG